MNRDFKTARRAWIVALIFFLACFIPSLGDWDMMNGGFAMILLSGFVSMSAVITAVMFRSRGKQAESLLSGTGEFVAEWSIPAELWREIIQRQYEEERTAKKILLRIVWFFCITIGIGFIVYDPEAGKWVAAVLLLLMIVTGLAATLAPRMRLRHLNATETRVRVGKTCVLLGDELHSWHMVGSWLQDAELLEEQGRHWLQVRYAFITRVGIQEEQVLLPVPPQELEKAQHAVDELMKLKRGKPPVIQI
jgi:hypothetical protein